METINVNTSTLNLYGRPMVRTADNRNFICTGFVPGPNVYMGFIVDDSYLPVPAGNESGNPHFRLGGPSAYTGLFDTETRQFTVTTQPQRMHELEEKTLWFGSRMALAQLATIVAYAVERDVPDVNSYLSADRLATAVSEPIVRLAYNHRLIGGRKLNADVVQHYNLHADQLDHIGHRNGRFLDSWKWAWTGGEYKRTMHGPVVNLTASVLAVVVRETADIAVSNFKASGRKPYVL